MKIILGPSSTELGRKIAEILGVKAVSIAHKKFPDGESYIRFEEEIAGDYRAKHWSTAGHESDSTLHFGRCSQRLRSKARCGRCSLPGLCPPGQALLARRGNKHTDYRETIESFRRGRAIDS